MGGGELKRILFEKILLKETFSFGLWISYVFFETNGNFIKRAEKILMRAIFSSKKNFIVIKLFFFQKLFLSGFFDPTSVSFYNSFLKEIFFTDIAFFLNLLEVKKKKKRILYQKKNFKLKISYKNLSFLTIFNFKLGKLENQNCFLEIFFYLGHKKALGGFFTRLLFFIPPIKEFKRLTFFQKCIIQRSFRFKCTFDLPFFFYEFFFRPKKEYSFFLTFFWSQFFPVLKFWWSLEYLEFRCKREERKKYLNLFFIKKKKKPFFLKFHTSFRILNLFLNFDN